MSPPRPPRQKKTPPPRWRTREAAAQAPRVVVVGFGRLGGALALGLKRAKRPVWVFPHSDGSVRRAVELGLPLADLETLRAAELCILAVPDSAVGRLSQTLRDDLAPQTALIHCAGALDLTAFGTDAQTLRRPRGSFHPLCAVSDPLDALEGHSVAIAASEPEVQAKLSRLAHTLGLTPIEVPEARRAAYHAGAVMGAGLLVGLASAASGAFAEAGISEREALDALLPLMRSALAGVERRGLARGVTGPVVRGDLSIVQAHLAALPADLSDIYRALSLRVVQLARESLPTETRHALERALKG